MRIILLLLLVISGPISAQVNLPQGLIGHYTFNGNANDISGNNINGTVSNATLTSDRNNNANSAYYFNGSNAYIGLPYSTLYNFAPQDSFSISVWVLPDQGYSWPAQALVVKSPPHPDFTLSLWNYGTYILNYKGMGGFAYNNVVNGTTTFVNNPCWYNIIQTYKNGVWKLYVNGVLESSDATQTRFILQDGPGSKIAFGKKGESNGDYYKGKMDDIRLYNRVLNPDEVFTISQSSCTQLTCNNWLRTQAIGQSVTVGDLDISGNQITVEANFNCTSFPLSGANKWEDIVSKHANTTDANYVLRMDLAAITTTTGHYLLSPTCDNLVTNKTYHVAFVYDGTTLKFYRNGFLMGQRAVTGNLILNNWMTTIGDYAVNNPVGTNFFGYINEVRIWNVARTQTQLQTYMNSSLPNPTIQAGLRGYYTFNNLLNKQGNTTYNGTLNGGASINNSNPNCTFIADSCAIQPCSTKNDFSFSRNACSPLSVAFATSATSYSSISWDFGDGNNANGVATTNNIFSNFGNYQITMITQYPNCVDTVKKMVTVDLQNDNQLIQTPDTIICPGSTKKLRTLPSLSFCWSPATYLDNPNIAEPTTSTPQNITYFYAAEVTGTNVISNGNFNNGNTSFTSDYAFANPNTTEGQYFVGSNPQSWNSSLSNCTDHTGSGGNMLLVNGSPTPNLKVWNQTVAVTPNTNYAFSTWIQALWPPNPAQLQFSINGKDIGSLITASLPTCTWTQFYASWNSGSSTSAIISIVNKNTQVQGNDFALDDISFAPVYIKRDSVKITVDTPSIVTNNNTAICEGVSVQLNTTGASTYSWSPVTGLSNPAIANPIATPLVTTQYIVTGINARGCTAKDTVDIAVSPKPVITKSADTTICQNGSASLFASGGNSYAWTPAASLNNGSIANPTATPTNNTTYYVTVTNAANCTNRDSVKVDVRSLNNFFINPPVDVCFQKSVRLNAAGGDIYNWIPAATLDNPNIAGPLASPVSTTTYTVQITDTLCNNSSSLSTIVTVQPLPTVTAASSNDIDCSILRSQLTAGGAAQYTWSPGATLSNTSGSITMASPTATTLYTVTGTSNAGCTNQDTVLVKVLNTNKGGYLMPNAFTPNNDGINDCYGIGMWGAITELEFSIYNRWGERVFYTTKVGDCWDGKFRGQLQNPGVFVYMIKGKTICEPSVFRKGTFVLIR